jgi:hypothetical protein
LSVVDVFYMQTAPRFAQDRMLPGKAVYHLATHPECYDCDVVLALAATIRATSHDSIDDAPFENAPPGPVTGVSLRAAGVAA